MLSGATGEFIRALPLTVAIALSTSFVVAMLLTPLSRAFLSKQGLHAAEEAHEHETSALARLALMQRGLHDGQLWSAMRHKGLTVPSAAAACGRGVGDAALVLPQQFFPSAERNQFVIDV